MKKKLFMEITTVHNETFIINKLEIARIEMIEGKGMIYMRKNSKYPDMILETDITLNVFQNELLGFEIDIRLI